jgi:hypothetical protein
MGIGQGMRFVIVILLSCCISVVPASGGSIIVGSTISGSNARVSQQDLRPGGTILSGDSLQVGDGNALVGIGNGSRMTFGQKTIASFQRESTGVTAVLDRGTVDLFHPTTDNSSVRLRIADVYVVPSSSFETLGEVAMTGDTLVVMTTQGSLRVEGGGVTREIPQGRMITLHSYPAAAPQISATTARPAFIHDLKLAGIAIVGAVGLALLVNHLINTNAQSECEALRQFNPPTSTLPANCR